MGALNSFPLLQIYRNCALLTQPSIRQKSTRRWREYLYDGMKVIVERLLNRVVAVVRRIGNGEGFEVALAHLKPMSGKGQAPG